MRTNYILIDFENVQPDSLEQLDHDQFKLLVFLGAHQGKVPVEVATSVQPLGQRAEYIQISGSGPNALDFHIAYYIGLLAAADPSAYFHIISKDSGFDPLIQHLRSKKIFARRATAIFDIPLVKVCNSKSILERIELILAKLRQPNVPKPRTVKKLGSTIATLFLRQLTENEVSALIDELVTKGYVIVSGSKITYAVSSGCK
jgi:PIN domain